MKMKRFVAVFVSVMMVLGTMAAVPAFADTDPTTVEPSVKVSGIAGFENSSWRTIQEAYEAIKSEVDKLAGLKEQTCTSDKFDQLYTNGGKITWKIKGEQIYAATDDTYLFSFGREAAYYGDKYLTAVNIIGEDDTAKLVLNKNIALPYDWWGNENNTMSAEISNITITQGDAINQISIGQSYGYKSNIKFKDCVINGNFYSYKDRFDLNLTFDGCTFNSPINASYAIFVQGTGAGTIIVNGCKFNNYTRGVNFQKANASFEFTNNKIESTVSEPDRGAIQLTDGAEFIITDNTIKVSGGNAFWFHNAATNANVTYTISGNNINAPYLANDDTTFDVNNKITNGGNAYNNTNTVNCMEKNATEPTVSTVTSLIPIAKIGDKGYATLADAVAAAQSGDTVTVISDIENMTTVVVAENKNITIDLNGHTIAAAVRSDNANKHYYAIDNYGTLTLNDSVGGGTISARGIENIATNSSTPKMTINGGTYLSIDERNGGAAVWNEGDLVVNGGTFKSTYRGSASDTLGAGCLNNSGTALITGGTFEGASARTYAIISTGELTVTPGEGKAVNVSGVHGGISSDSGKMVINGGNYSSEEFYGLYVSNDGVGTDPKTAFVTVNGGTFSGKNYSVWIGSDYNNPVNSSIAINGGTFNKPLNAQENTREGAICISGGTFTSDVADYVADGYYQKNNNDGTYTVLPAEAKVIDTAKTTGATVTLDNLNKNTAVDPAVNATYKVVVETAPAADAKKANEAIKANADTNTSKAIFDISVKKIDSNGVETDLGGENGVKDQQVTLTLGETPVAGSTVYIYHVVGTAEQIKTPVAIVTADGTNKVTFTAPSFSTYAVTYNAAPLSNSEIAKEVSVAFDRVGDTNEYDIVLKGKDNSKLNRFMSADLTFDMTVTDGAVGYTIEPSTNINIVDNGNGRYEFNLDGLNASGATGAEVPIGKVIFEGNGTVEFSVKTEGVTTNIVNTAKSANNIVDDYIPGGRTVDSQLVGNLYLDSSSINPTFTAPTKDLTVNIAYNNAITNNAAAYQDMTVTISGGDLTAPLTYALGEGAADVTYAENTYTVTVADKLTQNTAYTVTVEGAGYRTARYTVNMATNKTLNFWNNVLDEDEVIEVGKDSSKTTKNFLAGDIVKDNNINIYDLSAVVSYFGTSNDVTAASAYARYDLNRDGKIDSKDVAYVLVSWNN